MQKKPIVFGFDMGTASLGIALRVGSKIVHRDVHIFDEDAGSTKNAADKRRLWRTRLAHRAREYNLNQFCLKAGIPVLKQIEKRADDYRGVEPVDPKMTREFPVDGDKTVYNSALLRILMLEGKIDGLEGWQFYKALHSAIQRRGYGTVAWATKSTGDETKDKDEHKLKRVSEETRPRL